VERREKGARLLQRHLRVEELAARDGNAANPMVGSGMQQARDTRVEEAVRAVRNREGGTSRAGGTAWPKGASGLLGVDTRVNVDGGAEEDESHERRGTPSAERGL